MLLVSLFKEISEEALLSGKPMAFFMLFFWLFIFFKVLTSPEILYGLPILNRTLIKFDDFNLNSNNDLFKIGDNWILDAEVKKSNQDQRLEDNIKDNIKGYIIEVDKLSAVKKIFRHQKVSQNEIAAVLGVPTSHIFYLFNYHSKTSFSEYRMNSRIQDAISLMELGFLDNETLESLSNKIGFSSYNPFFTAFRKVTNYAPHEYLKVKKNEL